MKKINTTAMRSIDAGASKYVTCSICGYKRKTSLFERICQSNKRIQYYMSARHYKTMSGYNKSQSVHY